MSKLQYIKEWRRLPARIYTLYKAWRAVAHGPRAIQIEHTRRCNLKCVMCQHGMPCAPQNPHDMTLDEFKGCLKEAFSLGNLSAVQIQGLGEPFLHKDFLEMLRFAKSLGLQTYSVTNLTVLSEQIAEELVRIGHDHLAVSLDSPDPAFVASIRRGVSFDVLDRVVGNLRLIRRKQRELGMDKPEIVVFAIAMKDTLPQLPRLVALLKELEIHSLCFQELVAGAISPEERLPNGNRFVDEPLSTLPPDELKRAIEGMRSLSDKDITVVPSHIYDGSSADQRFCDGIYTCLDVWERPAIAVDGTVTPCCFSLGSNTLNMGDIKQNSFEDIWRGPHFAALRRAHLLDMTPKMCRDCDQRFQLLTPWRVWRRNSHPHRYDATFLDGRSGKGALSHRGA